MLVVNVRRVWISMVGVSLRTRHPSGPRSTRRNFCISLAAFDCLCRRGKPAVSRRTVGFARERAANGLMVHVAVLAAIGGGGGGTD